ncbi:hypothetical protein N4Q63_24345 [Leclercia adecarboxylata]|uniref:Uncharacterized protein n=2 Tax=Leclercia adecarboxylata TaxID=83655 RepID=A0A9X3YFZ3_9ENTR|nr:hypothetical protein [Leclercia adecarboxylata]MBD1405788.1 hypothetical protein [Leclercia adecarboxylata]MDC6625217.1 hypothetical protein [Leclercia adecarboxylata]MDC6636080.1 hypothetical protein [Leclercia adecarboxylata]MDC6641369.1 hypothetical protein [Leclercia adecarboxylata]MDC6652221.1 hypothetical protein [Leclercia adecarboxylata]
MSDGVVDSVKQVLEERLKNPLWGFIILSWVWFNWPNLAMLFMSDAPVKFRIDFILSQDFFYLHYIIAPVLSGGLLAIASPYAQWLLSRAHKWADDRYRDNVYQTKERDFEDAIRLSKLKVQSDRAVDLEKAKIDADIKAEVERGKREELTTQELESQKKALEERIENMTEKLKTEQLELEEINNIKQKHNDSALNLLSLLEKSTNIDGYSDIADLKVEITNFLMANGYEIATLKNTLQAFNNKPVRKKRNLHDFVDTIHKQSKAIAEMKEFEKE